MKKLLNFAVFMIVVMLIGSCSNKTDEQLDEYEKSVNKFSELTIELLNTNNSRDINVLAGEVSDTMASLRQMMKYLTNEIPEMTESQNLKYKTIRDKQAESAEIIKKILDRLE